MQLPVARKLPAEIGIAEELMEHDGARRAVQGSDTSSFVTALGSNDRRWEKEKRKRGSKKDGGKENN